MTYQLGMNHAMCSAYHPLSQGALERHHQTLKTMIQTYCLDNRKDLDDGIPLATKDITQAAPAKPCVRQGYEISAFVTPDGYFQCTVMTLGCKMVQVLQVSSSG